MAIILELDKKGYYQRYALTNEEFFEDFAEQISKGMSLPTAEGKSYTLKPMVHVWYKEVEIGCEYWQKFFTDMFFELSEGDIESNNAAEILWLEMGVLADCVRRTVCDSDCLVFPMITERVQHTFRKNAEGEKKYHYIPQICGYLGNACRCINDTKGANHIPCATCSLARFADGLRASQR